MSLEVVLIVVLINSLLTAFNAFQIARIRKDNDRADRYVAALLHKEGEYAAAKAVQPPAGAHTEKITPLQRPRQIGMTPR